MTCPAVRTKFKNGKTLYRPDVLPIENGVRSHRRGGGRYHWRFHRLSPGETWRERSDRGRASAGRGGDREIVRVDQRDVLKTSSGILRFESIGVGRVAPPGDRTGQ